MKITHLLEGSEASMPSPSQTAPKFGRSEEQIEETTVAGNVGGGDPTNIGMQRRGKGSMFQGISTSKKFVNSPVTEDDISEEHLSAKQRREEFFNKSKSRDIGNRPQDKDILPKQTFENDEEYDDEAGMIKTNLHTALRAVKGLHKTISDGENCPEWVQEKIAIATDYFVTCWDYLISQHEQGRKYEVSEASLGDYRKKAAMSRALAQINKQFYNDPKADDIIGRRTRGLQRVGSRDEINRLAQLEKDKQRQRENLPNYEKQLADLLKAYKAGGGDTWQYADRMMPSDIELRDMHSQIQNLSRIIHNIKKGMNEGQWQDIDGASAPPKGAKLQTKTIEPGSAIRVDPKYKEPNTPVAPKDNGMGRIVQGTWQADPKGTVKAPSGDPEGVKEVAPPGAKAERMVKHIKKSYAKDGKLTPKEKSIAYATAWKAHNKGKVEEQGVAEGLGGQKPTITYKDYTLHYDYQTEDDDPEGYSTATTYYFDVFKDGKRVGEAEYFDYFGDLTIRINGKTKKFEHQHPLASQVSKLVSSLPDEQKRDLSDPKFESKGVSEGSLNEYGDTAKGQKMLTKVQKRAVDRAIKADDKRDPKAAKKNADTANRAWERMTDKDLEEESKGLWANIHAKRERIKHGSGEHMRKPGSKGAPTADALRKSAK